MSQRRVVLVIARGVYQGEMRARKKKRRWSPRPPPFHGAHSSLTCPGYRSEITKKAARWRVVSRAAWRRRKRGSCELADACEGTFPRFLTPPRLVFRGTACRLLLG